MAWRLRDAGAIDAAFAAHGPAAAGRYARRGNRNERRGKPLIRALLLDLDGTLIDHSGGISPGVQRAVADVSGKMSVSIATGREPSHVVHYARQLGLTAPQIGDGGAAILDPATGDFLWSASLNPHRAGAILAAIDRAGMNFRATYPGGSATNMNSVPPNPINRISAVGLDEPTADGMAAHFVAQGGVEANKSYLPEQDLWAVDFTPRGVNKGTAARRVAAMLGVKAAEMAAVGDSYNDIPMLKFCGLAAAMGNAPAAVRNAADWAAPTADEDGVAAAIEWMLSEL